MEPISHHQYVGSKSRNKTEEGTPQGGPLSPLLGNIVLDELDKELEKRGHHFVRFTADNKKLGNID